MKLKLQTYSEFECQSAVISYIELLKNQTKKLTYHASPNECVNMQMMGKAKKAGMRKGWPDIEIFLSDSRMFFVEMKLPGTGLKDHQRHLHNELRALGYPVYVIRENTPQKAQNALAKILREDFSFTQATLR